MKLNSLNICHKAKKNTTKSIVATWKTFNYCTFGYTFVYYDNNT